MTEENQELAVLVRRAKQGEPSACEALIKRYRGAAVSWARAIVHDGHLAEDIAQEAFLRMIARLHQLQDEDKFTPWFRLLVRRLALNAVRGARHAREQVVDAMPDKASEPADPERWQKRIEAEEEIRESLEALPERSRVVMTGSAYRDETPEELAARLEMKKSNVYNILSRARSKMNDERYEKAISHYLHERRSSRKPVSVALDPPVISRPYAFLSVMVGEILRLIGHPPYAHAELMGISGEAFRLNVPRNCRWQDIATYDWSYAAYRMLEQLGVSGTCRGRPGSAAFAPEQQASLLASIQQSLDRGIPVIVRNMRMNEFGFICGYNDETREVRYRGYNREVLHCRYEQLGRNEDGRPLFVLCVHGKTSPPLNDAGVLRSIVRHARGQEPPLNDFAFGLAGYRLWLEAVESGTLDLSGHAYQVAILSEARQRAAEYLNLLADKYPRASGRLRAAADCYAEAAGAFTRMYPRFPFGYGGSHGNRFGIIHDGLTAARNAETQGVALLECCDL
jgi:RNA polymerase sigma factor (sigma-70 family)